MTELQQSKYQDLQSGLPSEISMQLAEVALALGSAEDQVTLLNDLLNTHVSHIFRLTINKHKNNKTKLHGFLF